MFLQILDDNLVETNKLKINQHRFKMKHSVPEANCCSFKEELG